ncbi:MAG: carbamoyltransferase HypF, partial [Gemmatimonadota bacterium]|nr:carbamoyltransferase HypF [Gemmatimonadota bacterium]
MGSVAAPARERRRLLVRGTVQGVGFRPFVYRLAGAHELAGWVRNTGAGVEIEVEGVTSRLDAFAHALSAEAPPLARLDAVEIHAVEPAGDRAFTIFPSHAREGESLAVPPDVATCAACLEEVNDPSARRYSYPFTNCTDCGPRFTIIEALPYDRARTTMRGFALCEACRAEYEDPADRRFHAEPIACPVCGPTLRFRGPRPHPLTPSPCSPVRAAQRHSGRGGTGLVFSPPPLWGRGVQPGASPSEPGEGLPEGEHAGKDALRAAVAALCAGQIVAVKGLGGFQLACNAADESAVSRLRERKAREARPFAIMVRDLEAARALCEISAAEAAVLSGPRAPIVLLRRRHPLLAEAVLAEGVAPGLDTLGIMLPGTPLHHLLLREFGGPLVMTSGNRSEEPIVIGNEEAEARLSGITDALLLHDREIASRYDDSVVRVDDEAPVVLRRARGFAPEPIRLPRAAAAPILATGAQLKNTFCLVRGDSAFVGQHIGDLDDALTLANYQQTLALYRRLFAIEPMVVAHDLHPNYAATRFAHSLEGVTLVAVQHHHAHVVSCMAEHGVTEPVIGVAFDGTGYGTDGAVWGGELLVADWRGFRRVAHLAYLPLPGGDAAAREPWRMALAALIHAFAEEAEG